MTLGGKAAFTFTAHPFVDLVKAPKLVGDQPFTRYSNKLFENLRHQADKLLNWPITFLKTLGLQKNTTSAWANFCLFKSVFLGGCWSRIACVYKPSLKCRYKCSSADYCPSEACLHLLAVYSTHVNLLMWTGKSWDDKLFFILSVQHLAQQKLKGIWETKEKSS